MCTRQIEIHSGVEGILFVCRNFGKMGVYSRTDAFAKETFKEATKRICEQELFFIVLFFFVCFMGCSHQSNINVCQLKYLKISRLC